MESLLYSSLSPCPSGSETEHGFLNYERQEESPPLFAYVVENYKRAINSPTNTLWTIWPCETANPNSETYSAALVNGRGAEWLDMYLTCLVTNPEVDVNQRIMTRILKAYNSTIFPQLQEAVTDFYAQPTSDPTNGAFSNLNANLLGDTYFTCVGGCKLDTKNPNSPTVYTYKASEIISHGFVEDDPAEITQQDIFDAYDLHIAQISVYLPNYNSVLQPVLTRDYDKDTGVLKGYIWSTRVYQRSADMAHFPRYQ